MSLSPATERTKEYRLRKARGPVTVPARGAVRRIRALQAIGWRLSDIAAEMGCSVSNLAMIAHRDQARVGVTRLARIDAAYQRLSGRPGPSEQTRKTAAARGWSPPLAWDDIDRDDAPQGVPTGRRVPGMDLDEFVRLVQSGESVVLSAKKVGGNPESVLRKAERDGHTEAMRAVSHEARVHRYAREAA